MLDIERGYWSRNDKDIGDKEDPQSETKRRVIPYVEDSRNCLLFEPLVDITTEQMASLHAALKRAIETRFQLEENELAAEPLPDRDNRQQLLFIEAAEGGAGVLRQLLDDPEALRHVARRALEICHFDRETGAALERATGADEDCEAACYDCLLSYRNQLEHDILDRKCINEWLLKLRDSSTAASPSSAPRDEHLTRLLNRCEADLEQKWLETLANYGMRLPDKAQPLIEACATRIWRNIDYKNLGPEELGSVYEGLLELHPEINVDSGTFALATAGGNERKSAGSYYTPSSLIMVLQLHLAARARTHRHRLGLATLRPRPRLRRRPLRLERRAPPLHALRTGRALFPSLRHRAR